MQEFEDFAQKATEELEELAQTTLNFCIGGFSFLMEESEKAWQEFSIFVEQLIREGEAQCNAWASQQSDDTDYKPNSPNEALRKRMFTLVKGDRDLAGRLLAQVRSQHPGHSETWYWEKVIYDLERDN